MAKWKQLRASRVFPDFKPVRNPRWLWDTEYGKYYDPLVWVKADGRVLHPGASTDKSKPSSGLTSL
tara:strand:- start:5885 stop:6082 length:198 start_codon:yes stop_codon:yes gene_type:complete